MNDIELANENKLEIINKEINIIDDLHKIMRDALLFREGTDSKVTDLITLMECIRVHTSNIYTLF